MTEHEFPYLDTRDLNLDWILRNMKKIIGEFTTIEKAFQDLKQFVDTYFDNLDVSEEVKNVLNEMYEDGRLAALVGEAFDIFLPGGYMTEYFNNKLNQPTRVYYRLIPRIYEPYISFKENGVEEPETLANETGATAGINASVFGSSGEFKGYFAVNGVVYETGNFNSNSTEILVYKDGHINGISVNTPAEDIAEQNYTWAITGFSTLISNGIPSEDVMDPDDDAYHPRSFIAQSAAGDYLIGTCDGRNEISRGFTYNDIYRFLVSKGYNDGFAYNLDGGGSVAYIEKGYRVNNYISNERRKIKSMICFKKENAYYSDPLKSASSAAYQLYHAGTTNGALADPVKILSSSDGATSINIYDIDGPDLIGYVRMSKERFYAGVGNGYSDSPDGHNLIDIDGVDGALRVLGINMALIHNGYSAYPFIDELPPTSLKQAGMYIVTISSSEKAVQLGLTAEDYSRSLYIRQFASGITVDLMITRKHLYLIDAGTIKSIV